MRYMRLRNWDSLHLAAQRDWSMEVITERERQLGSWIHENYWAS